MLNSAQNLAEYTNKNYAKRSFVSGNGADVPSYVEPVVTPGHEFSARVVQLGVGAAEVRLVTLDALQYKENVV